MRNLLFIISAMLLPLMAIAQRVSFNGLDYELKDDGTCSVVEKEWYDYVDDPDGYEITGDVVIPSTIEYNDVTYRVTSIGTYAFCYTKVTSVVVPSTVTSIGSECFMGTNYLTSVTLPEGLTSLGKGCFYQCWALPSITLPSTLTSMGDECFAQCPKLTSINIPDGITALGKGTFKQCEALPSITLPAGLKTLGESAFEYCYKLESINLPEGITTLEKKVFNYCRSLKEITLPATLNTINAEAFGYCGLTAIHIPRAVYTIDKTAFEYCPVLDDITVDENNPKFDSRDNCNAIIYKVATFNYGTNSGEMIRGGANTVIPLGVIALEDHCFSGNKNITSINIPSSVWRITNTTFVDCENLMSITIDEDNQWYDSRNDCNAVIKTSTNELIAASNRTVIPTTVVSIADNAFSRLPYLGEVTIPESVKTIGRNSFYSSGCTQLNLTSGLEKIENFAFCLNNDLTTIVCNNPTPPTVYSYTFYGDRASVKLYVPKDAIDLYKDAKVWQEFDIQAIGNSGIDAIKTSDGSNDGKFIIDGQVVIRHGDRLYNLSGQSLNR